MANPVRLILGTMTFAKQTNKETAIAMLKGFKELNKLETREKVEYDTARA
jgi:hypothetical protein